MKSAGADIIEISVDSVNAQRTWAEALGGIPFPITSDFWPHGGVAKSYEVFNEETGTARRSVFLVDPAGVIRWSHEYPRGTQPDGAELADQLKKLQAG